MAVSTASVFPGGGAEVSSAGTNSGTVLDRIVEARRAEVAHRKKSLPETVLRVGVQKADPVRDFAGALCRSGRISVIAELKKASPSAGVLRADFDPASLARGYEAAGAAALSVLTEEGFFQGSLSHLREARKAVTVPVLRKDFIVEPWQVWEARAANADTFLLIVAALSKEALSELLALGRELGMEPLVEVHTRQELDTALEAGARIVGVNNRDLHTQEVRVETSLELIEAIPEECIAVSESGLRTGQDLVRLRAAGFDAFLIGEHFMRDADPGAALGRLLASAE
jgi:indole-3-glycerol phosphate synthase